MVRFSFIFLLLFYNTVFSQSYPNPKIDSFIRRIIIKITEENYASADSLARIFKSEYPNVTFPYIYDAANEISKDFNDNLKLNNKRIYAALSQAEEIADSLFEADSVNIWNSYQKGLVNGYWAYFEGLKGNYFSAYDYGTNALNFFDKCLSRDSTFSDALIAEGTYEYWIAEKLGWLPFIPDNREHAIGLIYKGIASNSYLRNIGVTSLFWILKNEKKYDEAKNLIKKEYKKYPTNRYIISAYANIEKEFNKQRSVALYKKALEITLNRNEKNRINEIILRHKIAMLLSDLGKRNEAISECKKILAMRNLTPWESEKLDGRLEKVRELYLKLRVK